MKHSIALLLGLVTVGLPNAAFAERTIAYPTDLETWRLWSAEQGVPLRTMPSGSGAPLRLVIAKNVDHDVIRTGISCSAWDIINPMTQLVNSSFKDRASQAPNSSRAPVDVSVESATTVSRCVGTGELKATCITRVVVKGSIAFSGQEKRPLFATFEAPSRAIGVCAGLTRGIALVSRNAVIAFLEKVDEALRPTN